MLRDRQARHPPPRLHRSTTGAARQRLLETAYTLICKHGVRAVGVDTIIERSDVAKMTMYRHFGSKDELVIEVMRRRESLWTEAWLVDEVRRRTDQPAERLLTIFDVFDEWFRKRSFEGCLFINVLLEIDDRRSTLHRASRRHLANDSRGDRRVRRRRRDRRHRRVRSRVAHPHEGLDRRRRRR